MPAVAGPPPGTRKDRGAAVPFSKDEDIRVRVVRYAILAPSPSNTQPWRVAFRGNDRIVLSLDQSRALPARDPHGRWAFLSCGAFLENLEIAARQFGYRADIDLFPAGWPDPGKPLFDPVAHIDLEGDKNARPDPLFAAIPDRRTNRRLFSREEISLSVAGELAECADFELVPFGFSQDRDLVRAIRDLAAEAFLGELSDGDRFFEFLEYFRFTDDETKKARDGFGYAQSGHGMISRFFIGTFLRSRKSALRHPEKFVQKEVSCICARLDHCGGVGWLSTKGDYRIDQVRAGRVFERVHLKATSLSLALQPVTAPIADIPPVAGIRSQVCEFLGLPRTHTLQMLFRIGYAPGVPAPPRRDLASFFPAGEAHNTSHVPGQST
ncbi:MAG: nitroreductase family protein [Methanolinea sp.]|nr:nitroreductase family protein [Methanolinea sp.]